MAAWATMGATTLTWAQDLASPSTERFKLTKESIEIEMDAFYLGQETMRRFGFIRTVVVAFSNGSSAVVDTVKVKYALLFDSQAEELPSLAELRTYHDALISERQGKFSDTFRVDPASVLIGIGTP